MTEKAEEKIPTTLITGFLGSGKTTLLNGLLAHPALKDTAVIVNEFGDVGLDHLLIETSFEDAVLLQSGCVCCTVRGDLVDTLVTLDARRRRGEIPPFKRIVIETTGLADPVPIIQILTVDPQISPRVALAGVITTVDAVNGEGQLDTHFASAKQAAVADRLVLTKTDLVDDARRARIVARLRALNPTSPILAIVEGRIEPDALLDFAPVDDDDIARRLRAAAAADDHDHAHAAPDDDAAEADHAASHLHGITAFCLVRETAVSWPALQAWLIALSSLKGPDFLRMKGIFNVSGWAGPVVIHGVQHVFHPPRELPRWPGEDRRSRVVFITRNISEETVGRSFAAAMDRAVIPGREG